MKTSFSETLPGTGRQSPGKTAAAPMAAFEYIGVRRRNSLGVRLLAYPEPGNQQRPTPRGRRHN